MLLQDLSTNLEVQQGLKRTLARVAGGAPEAAVNLLWSCLAGGPQGCVQIWALQETQMWYMVCHGVPTAGN